jgi:hypothetical protein
MPDRASNAFRKRLYADIPFSRDFYEFCLQPGFAPKWFHTGSADTSQPAIHKGTLRKA